MKSQLTSPTKVMPHVQDHLPSTIFRKREGSLLNPKVFFYFRENPLEIDENFAWARREGIDFLLSEIFSS